MKTLFLQNCSTLILALDMNDIHLEMIKTQVIFTLMNTYLKITLLCIVTISAETRSQLI